MDVVTLKRIFILVVCWLLIANTLLLQGAFADDLRENEPCVVLPAASGSASKIKPPVIDAGAAVVMDVDSGRILYEKNAFSRRAMASTTKIMTAIVAIENADLSDMVTVSKRAAGIWGSDIGLKVGETVRLKELMYGMMLESGNDAAIAVAEHVGGTVENFAEMMNRKAQDLGAKDTNFRSPHGLDADGHYSTAYDMALITRYALRNPVFSKIVGTSRFTIGGRTFYSTNELLGAYKGADGVKTGYTGKAGRCLVASATRGNWRIISVVLGSPTRTKRAQGSVSILDYAFGNYKPYKLLGLEENIRDLPVTRGIKETVSIRPVEEIRMPLKQEEIDGLETEIDLPERLEAPVGTGIEVGSIKYLVGGKVIGQSALKTNGEVPRKGFFDYLREILYQWGRIMRFQS